jgi:hypothetical protein
MSAHLAARPKWSRRAKLTISMGVVLAFIAGAALAAFTLKGPITGGGTIVPPPGVTFVSVQTGPANVNTDCSASIVSGALNINFSNARVDQAAAVCVVTPVVRLTSAEGGGKFQNVSFSTTTVEKFFGTPPQNCGKSLNPGADIPVTFTLTIPKDTPTGAFTAEAGAGLTVVDSAAYQDANCP